MEVDERLGIARALVRKAVGIQKPGRWRLQWGLLELSRKPEGLVLSNTQNYYYNETQAHILKSSVKLKCCVLMAVF